LGREGGGALPEFLESIYKIDTGSDHVAKFRGDQPRELGDYEREKKENITNSLKNREVEQSRPEHILRIFLKPTKGEAAESSGDVRGVPSWVLWPVPY